MDLQQNASAAPSDARVKIAVPLLPHIANFDDFDPLRQEPDVELLFVALDDPLPMDARLVVIPGSKSTIPDLEFLRTKAWEHDLHAYVRRGGRVLGICAGYQMLGTLVRDPLGIEGSAHVSKGLGLLDIETEMRPDKTLKEITGVDVATGTRVRGYEMHIGVSVGPATARPMLRIDDGSSDGAISRDGRVSGCYVHGLFHSSEFRARLLGSLGARSSGEDHAARVDAALDEIAAALEKTLHVDSLLRIGA